MHGPLLSHKESRKGYGGGYAPKINSQRCVRRMYSRVDCAAVLGTSKWTWGPVERPVLPIKAITSPRRTINRPRQIFLIMRVARTESIAVGNFNHRAITRPMATPTYYATGNGQYVRAIATRKIDARVPRTFTRNGVYAVPVRRGLPSSPNRPPRWCRLGAELLS